MRKNKFLFLVYILVVLLKLTLSQNADGLSLSLSYRTNNFIIHKSYQVSFHPTEKLIISSRVGTPFGVELLEYDLPT
jgi:hypothetical protein